MVTSAAGTTIRQFTRNLSRISHPWVRVAAMVVSEMNERLSPKNEPPTTTATIMAAGSPVCPASPAATGVRATMVPTEVPIDSEMKQVARKIPAGRNRAGMRRIVRSTAASIAPMALADWANAPARTKIHIMTRIPGLAAPRQNSSMRCVRLKPRVTATAHRHEKRKATVMGTL